MFPTSPQPPDGAYRTVYGPAVAHDGVTYCKCNHCESLALRRLTAVRVDYGTEYYLQWQQKLFHERPDVNDFFQRVARQYAPHFNDYTDAIYEAHVHHADPHAKKKLRIQAWDALCDNSLAGRLWLRSVTYKLKRIEIAKPGKYGRMIGDLGVAASLQGFRLTNALKIAQDSEVIHFDGGYARFIKSPDIQALQEAFDDLISPPGRFVFVFFSDDACYSYRDATGQVHMYNLDISSCDASHGPSIFDRLLSLVPEGQPRADMQVLVDQCKLPIKLNDCGNHKRKVLLQPVHPRLYSGSTITTSINNVANLSIIAAIRLHPDLDPVQAAVKAGYIITMDKCSTPEGLQFLKHSPIKRADGSGYAPLLNLGVLLRLSGTCKGDLPGRGDLDLRARKFQGALLHGVSTHARYRVLDNMRSAFPNCQEQLYTDAVNRNLSESHCSTGATNVTLFDDESVYARYGLNEPEIQELLAFSHGRIGYTYGGCALSKVLTKDYGLTA